MKTFLRIACLLCAMLLCVGALASCGGGSGTNYAANNTEYYIGLSGPLTGGAAVYGMAAKNGAQLAVDEINAAGGLNGVMFKLVTVDDKHDASNIPTNYATLYEGGMQVSLGTVTSAPALEFKTYAKDDNVFFITPSASNDDVPEYENGYQMCFADGNQGKVAADYVNDAYKGQTIGVFYKSDEAYSKGIFDQFSANLDSSITMVTASFNDATATDFSTQIDTLKDCTFIFMPIYYTPASLFMTQAVGIIADNAIYYGCDGLDGIDSMEGFDVNSVPQEISMLSHFNSKATDGAAGEFIKKYVEKFGADTLNQFGASAYDCVYAIFAAMKEAYEADNSSVYVTMSASDLCKVLEKKFQGGFKFTGITGTDITWDAHGYVNKTAIKYVVKAGK
ncbi:MAG: ABC transporter substrate-binding protein [Clostridia bacterium]|nr:ABC transporter substrate-binding protein [Clostridia bacterium]